jgi:hypothetical protein
VNPGIPKNFQCDSKLTAASIRGWDGPYVLRTFLARFPKAASQWAALPACIVTLAAAGGGGSRMMCSTWVSCLPSILGDVR